MLRDTAIAWVKANAPDRRFQSEFARKFDEAARHGHCFFVAIGPRMTVDGRLRLVYCICGERFVFELDKRQAAAYGLKPGVVMWGTGQSPEMQSVPDPPVNIGFEIMNADALPGDEPIIGGTGNLKTTSYRADPKIIAQTPIQIQNAA